MSPSALSRPSRRARAPRRLIALATAFIAAAALLTPAAATSAPAVAATAESATGAFQACSVAEQRASQRWWYFGSRAGLDFGTDGSVPTPVTGALAAAEGSTVITDPDGELLFYSNAGSIFNRNHVVMANGTGLNGNNSAIQTVAAFPAVGTMNRYFVVTTNASGLSAGGRLAYSEVDMSLANGLGGVIAGRKNLLFGPATSSSEALAAVPTADGTGFWVITTKYNSTQVLAYRFDGTGLVSETPVISEVSTTLTNVFGSIEFDSTYSQAVITSAKHIRVLDFDAATGAFTEQVTWPLAGTNYVYHAAFSPTAEHVYVSEYRSPAALYRYRIAGSPTTADVVASRERIATATADAGQVRPAPDGRMYWTVNNANALHAIAEPDAESVTYLPAAVRLAPGTSARLGLPQMVTGCERRAPALTIDKSSDAAALTTPGDLLTYTITATNTGTHDHTDADPTMVADDLTETLRQATWAGDMTATVDGTPVNAPVFDPATGMLTWRGALGRNETVTITYRVEPTPGSDLLIRNIAWNPTDPGDLTPPACTSVIDGKDMQTGQGCARDVSTIFHPDLDVALDRTRPSGPGTSASVGDTITYTVTVQNPGDGHFYSPSADTAGNPVTLIHDLAGIFDDATLTGAIGGGATITDGVLTWTGPLAPGASHQITFTVTVTDRGDGLLAHDACATGDSRDAVIGTLTACAADELPIGSSWTLTKRAFAADGSPLADDATLTPGDEIRYDIVATATGRHDFAGIVLRDDPRGLQPRAAITGDVSLTIGTTSPQTIALTGDGLIETPPFTLPRASTATLSYTVTVAEDATAGDLRNIAYGTGAHAPTACATLDAPCETRHGVVVPASPTPIAPGAPGWNQTCDSPPWLDLPVQPGIRYDLEGEVAPGATVTIIASSGPGTTLIAAAGWTLAPDGQTASYAVTFPACDLGSGGGPGDDDGTGGGDSPDEGTTGVGTTPEDGGLGGGTPEIPGTGGGATDPDGGTGTGPDDETGSGGGSGETGGSGGSPDDDEPGTGTPTPVGSPGTPEIDRPTCTDGVVTMPTLRVRLIPGARYEVTGTMQAGGTITLTAYAEPGHVLSPISSWAAGSWTVADDARSATHVHTFPAAGEICDNSTTPEDGGPGSEDDAPGPGDPSGAGEPSGDTSGAGRPSGDGSGSSIAAPPAPSGGVPQGAGIDTLAATGAAPLTAPLITAAGALLVGLALILLQRKRRYAR